MMEMRLQKDGMTPIAQVFEIQFTKFLKRLKDIITLWECDGFEGDEKKNFEDHFSGEHFCRLRSLSNHPNDCRQVFVNDVFTFDTLPSCDAVTNSPETFN